MESFSGMTRLSWRISPSPLPGRDAICAMQSTGSAFVRCAAVPLHPWLHSIAPAGANTNNSNRKFVRHPFPSLRQWLALGFRGKKYGNDADKENRTHRHCGVT